MSCYLTDRMGLHTELNNRRARKEHIVTARNEFIRNKYGIDDFQALLEKHIGTLGDNQDGPWGLLCRQVPTITFEDVICYCACRILGLQPAAMSMTGDRFVDKNPEKRCLIKHKVAKRSNKNNRLVTCYRRLFGSMNHLNGRALNSIRLSSGESLVDWHFSRRSALFTDYPVADMNAFLVDCLYQSGRPPTMCYRTDETGLEGLALFDPGTVGFRPPAEWYYPLYLSMFMDGSLVLLESYEDAEDRYGQAKQLFLGAFEMVYRQTGWSPLVIEIPTGEEMFFYSERWEQQGLPHFSIIKESVNGSPSIDVVFKEIKEALLSQI